MTSVLWLPLLPWYTAMIHCYRLAFSESQTWGVLLSQMTVHPCFHAAVWHVQTALICEYGPYTSTGFEFYAMHESYHGSPAPWQTWVNSRVLGMKCCFPELTISCKKKYTENKCCRLCEFLDRPVFSLFGIHIFFSLQFVQTTYLTSSQNECIIWWRESVQTDPAIRNARLHHYQI